MKKYYEAVPVEEALPPVGRNAIYIYADGSSVEFEAEARHTVESLKRQRLNFWLREVSAVPSPQEAVTVTDEEIEDMAHVYSINNPVSLGCGTHQQMAYHDFIAGAKALRSRLTGKQEAAPPVKFEDRCRKSGGEGCSCPEWGCFMEFMKTETGKTE